MELSIFNLINVRIISRGLCIKQVYDSPTHNFSYKTVSTYSSSFLLEDLIPLFRIEYRFLIMILKYFFTLI